MKKQIGEIIERLSREFDHMAQQGMYFESIFGCERDFQFHHPHVLVRAELRSAGHNKYYYRIDIDLHPPLCADRQAVRRAEEFRDDLAEAIKLARDVETWTTGQEWTLGEVDEYMKANR